MRDFTIGVLVGIVLCWITILMAIAAYGLLPGWKHLSEQHHASRPDRLR